MAEGIALAIPGLFLNCVEVFTLVELGVDFKEDFKSWNLQLHANELRFKRWGEAAGITDEQSATFVKQLQKDYKKKDIKLAYNACDQIKTQLERAKEDSKKMILLSDDQAELEVIDELQELQISEPAVKQAHGALSKLKSRYQSGRERAAQVVVRTKWALYKKTQLNDLLRVIADHVEVLEKLFPQRGKALAAQEARELEPAAIKALKEVATTSDPLLEEALAAEAPQKGISWDGIVNDGYAVVHLGHNFKDSNARAGPASYNKMKNGGNATVHAGNNYGFDAPAKMQSAFGSDPKQHTGPGAMEYMDREDFASGPGSNLQ